DRDRDQVDQGQGKADRDAGKACRRALRRGADDDEEEEESHHDLGNKTAAEAVLAGAEIAVPIGSKATHDPTGLARRDPPQYQGGNDRADDLGDDVRNDVSGAAAPGAPQTNGDRWIEMATQTVTDGKSHGRHGQPEREANPQKADPEFRKPRRQHAATAAAQSQPQGSENLRDNPPRHVIFHRSPPALPN